MRHPIDLTAARQGVFAERAFVWICRLGAAIPLTMLAWLLIRIGAAGVDRLSWSFLTDPPSQLNATAAGLGPALQGTLWLVTLTAVIALPVGIGAAVYLEEYDRRSRLAGVIELAISNLAGVPSIVYGMLGLGLFVHALAMGETVIAGALTLALLILPIVITSAREALRTVKDALREAALGLGATRWQATRQVVLPMALPGILTGAILAVARAIGETAPLVVVGAVAFIMYGPDGVDSRYTALPMQIFQWTSNPKRAFLDNAAAGILVLMGTLLVLNGFAIWLRNRTQARRS
ncbi:MAG: phosphate ABC transporter permease PstA [Myxococcales bacterium]|nr:phosphate ABC transporter permease PstA [Myxococcales bacterium]